MITTKEFKIKIPEKFTSAYMEKELANTGYDVLRWAITGCCEDYYIVNAAVIEKKPADYNRYDGSII